VPPALALTGSEMSVLLMCQAFARHLLGNALFEEASTALEKNRALAGPSPDSAEHHFTSYKSGSIDYTPHEEGIKTLLKAMEQRSICKVIYCSLLSNKSKTFLIMPLKIFSHNDSMYLSARFAGKPGKIDTRREYDPLLAVHRLKRVEITDQSFEFPKDYDFEQIYNRNFGIIKDNAFHAEVEFTGLSGRYVAERMWSPDQRIHRIDDSTLRITFSASSDKELISWLLSFGDEARLIKPQRLIDSTKEMLKKMEALYDS
jgi:predicted DNA-binding transcriptional regulator YafY